MYRCDSTFNRSTLRQNESDDVDGGRFGLPHSVAFYPYPMSRKCILRSLSYPFLSSRISPVVVCTDVHLTFSPFDHVCGQ